MTTARAAGTAPLSAEELERYGRHLTLPEVGLEGQRRLKAASVLLVGAGGLGSPAALYLAAAGVGRLGLVDFDRVEASNLQRQVLHGSRDVGRPKLDSARERLADLNPHVTLDLHETRLARENALDIVTDYDVVVDGTDNFPTRYLINDACVLSGTPCVYGSILGFEGQVSVFAAANGPCYRCVYPEPPRPDQVPSCAEGGVLGVLPGIIGTLQAAEALKLLLGAGRPLAGRLLLVDALTMHFRTLSLKKNPDCPVCGDSPTQTTLIDYDAFCGVSQTNGSMSDSNQISVHELKARRDAGDAPFVLDVRKPDEVQIADIGSDQLIPLQELADRLDELKASEDEEIVVFCRSGGRSQRATQLLRAVGYQKTKNLTGGILAWSEEIDPDVPKY